MSPTAERSSTRLGAVAPAPSGPRSSLVLGMLAALVGVAVLAYWGARRESAAALADFGEEQARLIESVAVGLRARLPVTSRDPATERIALGELVSLERSGANAALLTRQGRSNWTRVDGRVADVPEIDAASRTGERWTILPRADAALLGLPLRTAVAGIATVGGAPSDGWQIAIVTTAERERDRELRVQAILVLGVILAAGLVLAFGGVALRKQRKGLELVREVAVAAAQRESDDRLVRADKLATLGALATGIAHEVSTPLGVIVGRAEQLLPKVAGDERAQRSVDAILEQGERISRVIRGFLSLARGASPTFEHVDPASIVRKSIALVDHRFANAGVALKADFGAFLPMIACEPRLLEQALVNLLLNACDACERSHGHVAVHVRGDLERVAFVVTDDGVGIARESAARVFEPFFTTKPDGAGTGLGLAIAHEIIKHHRGTLTIAARGAAADETERGTRACIEIPTAMRAHAQLSAA